MLQNDPKSFSGCSDDPWAQIFEYVNECNESPTLELGEGQPPLQDEMAII